MNGQIHFNIALACQSQLIHLKELFWYNLKKFSYLIFSFIAISKDTFFTGRAFFWERQFYNRNSHSLPDGWEVTVLQIHGYAEVRRSVNWKQTTCRKYSLFCFEYWALRACFILLWEEKWWTVTMLIWKGVVLMAETLGGLIF